MSHQQNDLYRESALEQFDECIETADHAGAKKVIAQLKQDGFTDEAYDLEAQLLDVPLSKFVISLNIAHI